MVRAVIGQFGDWAAAGDGKGWFAEFAADAPATDGLDEAARSAIGAITDLRNWLEQTYLPLTAGAVRSGRRRTLPGLRPQVYRREP